MIIKVTAAFEYTHESLIIKINEAIRASNDSLKDIKIMQKDNKEWLAFLIWEERECLGGRREK